MAQSDLSKRIGNRIKYYRKKNKLTQKDLEKISGVKQNTLARLERGEHHASTQTLEKLAQAFNIDIRDLFKS